MFEQPDAVRTVQVREEVYRTEVGEYRIALESGSRWYEASYRPRVGFGAWSTLVHGQDQHEKVLAAIEDHYRRTAKVFPYEEPSQGARGAADMAHPASWARAVLGSTVAYLRQKLRLHNA